MKTLINSILKSNKSQIMADQAVFSANSFVATILMARIFSTSDFGLYASVILFIYFIVSALNAVVIQPLQVTLSKIKNQHSYISFSFWVQFILVAIISVLAEVALGLNLSYLTLYNGIGQSLVIFSAGFVMHDYFRKLFLARANIRKVLAIDIITALLHLGILITVLFSFQTTLKEVLFYLGLGYVPGFIIGVAFTKPWYFDRKEWKLYSTMHLHQSKWLLLTSLVQWWSSNLFVVASGVFLGIKALGAFRLVQSIFGVLNMLLQTFENYALPQTSRLLYSSSAKARDYLKQLSIKSSVFFGFVLILTFICSKSIIILAGGTNYIEYAYVVKGMSVLYFFIFLGYPVRMAIRALVLNKHFFIGYLFSLIFSLSSFNFLLDSWNLTGAIVGLIFSQLILLSYWQLILISKNFILWK